MNNITFKRYIFNNFIINVLNYIILFSIVSKFNVEKYAVYSYSIFTITVINQLFSLGIFEYLVKKNGKISQYFLIHALLLILITFTIVCIKNSSKNFNSEILEWELIYSLINMLIILCSSYLISIKRFDEVLSTTIIGIIIKIIIYYFNINNYKDEVKFLYFTIIMGELFILTTLIFKILKTKIIYYEKEYNYKLFFKKEIFPYITIGVIFFIFISSDRFIIPALTNEINTGAYFFTYQIYFSPFMILGYQAYDYLLPKFINEKLEILSIKKKIYIILIIIFILIITLSLIINIILSNSMYFLFNDQRYLIKSYFIVFSLSAFNIIGVKILTIYFIVNEKINLIEILSKYLYIGGIALIYLSCMLFDIYGVITVFYVITLFNFIVMCYKMNIIEKSKEKRNFL